MSGSKRNKNLHSTPFVCKAGLNAFKFASILIHQSYASASFKNPPLSTPCSALQKPLLWLSALIFALFEKLQDLCSAKEIVKKHRKCVLHFKHNVIKCQICHQGRNAYQKSFLGYKNFKYGTGSGICNTLTVIILYLSGSKHATGEAHIKKM